MANRQRWRRRLAAFIVILWLITACLTFRYLTTFHDPALRAGMTRQQVAAVLNAAGVPPASVNGRLQVHYTQKNIWNEYQVIYVDYDEDWQVTSWHTKVIEDGGREPSRSWWSSLRRRFGF